MNKPDVTVDPGHPRPVGRPRTLDENVQGKLVVALAAGLSLREAAAWIRTSHSTVYYLSHHNEKFERDLEYCAELARLHPHLCIYQTAGKSWEGAACLLELLERRHGKLTTDRLFQALHQTIDHAYESAYGDEE